MTTGNLQKYCGLYHLPYAAGLHPPRRVVWDKYLLGTIRAGSFRPDTVVTIILTYIHTYSNLQHGRQAEIIMIRPSHLSGVALVIETFDTARRGAYHRYHLVQLSRQ